MLRRRSTLTVLTICWLMILGVATPAYALEGRAQSAERGTGDGEAQGKGSIPPPREIESLGWVLDFDLGAQGSTKIRATFRYMVSFVDSAAPYDVHGTVAVSCKHYAPSEPYRCTIPDMPATIYNATGGSIDLSTMELPLGNLDVCGSINRVGDGIRFHAGSVTLVSTSPTDLYGLSLVDDHLMLTHSSKQTSQQIARASRPFHLMLPDTTLVAPREYILSLLPEVVDYYALEELTIIDPGAFAHRLAAGTSCADDLADRAP
jgi:hypothetical protein